MALAPENSTNHLFLAETLLKLKKKEEAKPAEPPKPSKEEVLLTEIRDALRAK